MGHVLKNQILEKTDMLLKKKKKSKESDVDKNAKKDHLTQNDHESWS